MNLLDQVLAADVLPDAVVRRGIRHLLAGTLREKRPPTAQGREEALRAYIAMLREDPIALQTKAANQQHYEVPTHFYELVLGRRLKYSCALWSEPADTLDQAEERMLALTCERAQLADGQQILELGCGWGSLTLWMAERYPGAQITAVSNSRTQKEHIDDAAARAGHQNVTVLTEDMNTLALERTFDRMVSVEMFEHMRNYQLLMDKIAGWLAPGGRLFVHIFTHRELAYLFEDRGESDWMARHFFTGGQMPSADLLPHFRGDLALERYWVVEGGHYQKTAEAWLANLDARRAEIQPLFEQAYGRGQARRWRAHWRIFFLACAELFGYDGGKEWQVSHYRFRK
jgi:cyclopropane-fatty-acyl-phospholipid synthase